MMISVDNTEAYTKKVLATSDPSRPCDVIPRNRLWLSTTDEE